MLSCAFCIFLHIAQIISWFSIFSREWLCLSLIKSCRRGFFPLEYMKQAGHTHKMAQDGGTSRNESPGSGAWRCSAHRKCRPGDSNSDVIHTIWYWWYWYWYDIDIIDIQWLFWYGTCMIQYPLYRWVGIENSQVSQVFRIQNHQILQTLDNFTQRAPQVAATSRAS